METRIVATIEGRHYVYAREVERDYWDSPHALEFEMQAGLVRGLRYRVNGGRERILLDLEDAKIIADLCEMLTLHGIPTEKQRPMVMDYFANRAGFDSWPAAWRVRHDVIETYANSY